MREITQIQSWSNPKTIEQLARAMERNGRVSKARGLRVSSWEEYVRTGNAKAADVLAGRLKQSQDGRSLLEWLQRHPPW